MVMAHIICSECGTDNDADARFCAKCDAYLAWDGDTLLNTPEGEANAPVTPVIDSRGAPPERSDTAARPPQLTLSATAATLGGDTGAQFDIRVHNTSTIVDAFRVDAVTPPRWLMVSPAEVRVLPNESDSIGVVLTLAPDARVAAQTVNVTLRVSSLRDTGQFVDTPVAVTVARSGAPLKLAVQPMVIRLIDQNEGSARLVLDNSASKLPSAGQRHGIGQSRRDAVHGFTAETGSRTGQARRSSPSAFGHRSFPRAPKKPTTSRSSRPKTSTPSTPN